MARSGAVAVAVNPIESAPTQARIHCSPSRTPSVQPVEAIPWSSEVASVRVRLPLPDPAAKLTRTPGMGVPPASSTRTAGSTGRRDSPGAVWASPPAANKRAGSSITSSRPMPVRCAWVARISALPGPRTVARPVFETVATRSSLEDQWIAPSWMTSPSASRTWAR